MNHGLDMPTPLTSVGLMFSQDLTPSARNLMVSKLNHKLLGNFSTTFEIFGDFCDFRELLIFF